MMTRARGIRTLALLFTIAVASMTIGCRFDSVMSAASFSKTSGAMSTTTTAGVAYVFPKIDPLPDRFELLTMLREKRFDDLEQRLTEATRGEATNPDAEWRAETAFGAFAVADPSLTLPLDAFVARTSSPSPLALVARARH